MVTNSIFGGVYYLFLRGIDPKHPGFGIYRDRLEETFVGKLNDMLAGAQTGQGVGYD